ncbi:MAG TPA: glycine cleavage system protein GcvH [Candidatus Binatia bacterium]|nr:glycine cleavage system protein GcvH [Candidatus Binatia bacterium]
MEFPKELHYSHEHEWVAVEENIATIGITDYAQEQLGDVVYVELPEIGAQVTKDEAFGVVESVKAVSDIYAPVSGTVTEINVSLPDSPETVNEDPYGDAWMIRVEMSDPGELDDLMTAAQYKKFVAEEQGEE